MTYLSFLLIFLVIPDLVLLLLLRPHIRRRHIVAMGVLALLALAYTAPWDNLIVLQGVWTYDPDRVLGVAIGVVPLEEYGFYVLQVVLTSLFTLAVLRRAALSAALEPRAATTPDV